MDLDHTGSRLLSGSRDNTLRIFDFNSMKSTMKSFRKMEPSDGHPMLAVSWSPSGLLEISVHLSICGVTTSLHLHSLRTASHLPLIFVRHLPRSTETISCTSCKNALYRRKARLLFPPSPSHPPSAHPYTGRCCSWHNKAMRQQLVCDIPQFSTNQSGKSRSDELL